MIRTIITVSFGIFLIAGCSKKDNDTKSEGKELPNQTENRNEGKSTMHANIETVSYTHLTLPTICSV